ncbi:MAG: 16S rRNA (guanine(966)-N(2))-methyltransferase RsmD [Clostridia bacterium]|nr:16S rRNA (guanine(966)-N(2))-methyltransferase RsmD [Clostridia bacterium]
MRVITGISRGIKLQTLEGTDVRPTTDMVKEAIFNTIQFEITGQTFLDLFAGSGQIGIEALSRGAKSATFVDANPDAVKVIKNNLEKTRLSNNATVFRNDYFSFLAATNEKFDIIFLDPPYRQNILEKALNTAVNCLSSNGFIICEHPVDIPLPEFVGNLKATKTTRYGKICITIYRKESE